MFSYTVKFQLAIQCFEPRRCIGELRRAFLIILLALAFSGCGPSLDCPRVIYLDGAGWHSGDGPVRKGLRRAGFKGPVERFGWQSLLGPLHDHLTAGGHHPRAKDLARRISRLRHANPEGRLILMGLSAGTSIIVSALERLPTDVEVDYVVLLSPSVSSEHNLSKAMRHVKYRLYATHSVHDSLLALGGSAGLERGHPAGQMGFAVPSDLADEERELYDKVVNLPWRPGYAAYGWNGGHVSVTSSDFIRVVVAPRILEELPHPLDRHAAKEVAEHE